MTFKRTPGIPLKQDPEWLRMRLEAAIDDFHEANRVNRILVARLAWAEKQRLTLERMLRDCDPNEVLPKKEV